MSSDALIRTERTTVRRQPARASYDREAVNAVLDEALLAHVAFVVDGTPVLVPMAHWRVGDRLFLHGAAASRFMRALRGGLEACVSVTLLDGLVFARSAFHHSMNYRSVVLYGVPEVVDDMEAKRAALAAFVEHVAPGRAAEARPPSEGELAGTVVLSLAIAEASAKTRSGPPADDAADMAWPAWAGVVPLRLTAGTPVQAPDQAPDVPAPAWAAGYDRGRATASPA